MINMINIHALSQLSGNVCSLSASMFPVHEHLAVHLASVLCQRVVRVVNSGGMDPKEVPNTSRRRRRVTPQEWIWRSLQPVRQQPEIRKSDSGRTSLAGA